MVPRLPLKERAKLLPRVNSTRESCKESHLLAQETGSGEVVVPIFIENSLQGEIVVMLTVKVDPRLSYAGKPDFDNCAPHPPILVAISGPVLRKGVSKLQSVSPYKSSSMDEVYLMNIQPSRIRWTHFTPGYPSTVLNVRVNYSHVTPLRKVSNPGFEIRCIDIIIRIDEAEDLTGAHARAKPASGERIIELGSNVTHPLGSELQGDLSRGIL
jgi:hypothetical protein